MADAITAAEYDNAAALMSEQVSTNATLLAHIQAALGEPLFRQLEQNKADLNKVWRKLRSVLQGRVQANNYYLRPIGEKLADTLHAAVNARDEQLASIPMVAGPGHGRIPPEPTHPGALLTANWSLVRQTDGNCY